MVLSTRKLAAVTAAVVTYIKTGEEAALSAQAGLSAQGLAGPVPAAPPAPAAPALNAWGVAGRTDQMQGRTLMQLRAFR